MLKRGCHHTLRTSSLRDRLPKRISACMLHQPWNCQEEEDVPERKIRITRETKEVKKVEEVKQVGQMEQVDDGTGRE